MKVLMASREREWTSPQQEAATCCIASSLTLATHTPVISMQAPRFSSSWPARVAIGIGSAEDQPPTVRERIGAAAERFPSVRYMPNRR